MNIAVEVGKHTGHRAWKTESGYRVDMAFLATYIV